MTPSIPRKINEVNISWNLRISSEEIKTGVVVKNNIELLKAMNINIDRTAPTRKSKSFSFRNETNNCKIHANMHIEDKAICRIRTGAMRKVKIGKRRSNLIKYPKQVK
jgi:hypothetical protein